VSPKKPRNAVASVRQRLLNRSREAGEDFQQVLTRYAIERLLYRVGASKHAGKFVLKGAMLFALWTGQMHRPTRDLDLLGFGDISAETLHAVFRDLCAVGGGDDGLDFLADSVAVEPIRADQEYGGQRLRLEVRLGTARVDLQIDVGFGDAVTPAAQTAIYPTLLDMPAPRLRAYPKETVVAEKLQAMVQLGMANSRMKDFFDLRILARQFAFTGPVLRDAIAATFTRRATALPDEAPVALTEAFAADTAKPKQWAAFINRSGLGQEAATLGVVVTELACFLLPPMTAAALRDDFHRSWPPGGPWTVADPAGPVHSSL
jgi:hypothetical protein